MFSGGIVSGMFGLLCVVLQATAIPDGAVGHVDRSALAVGQAPRGARAYRPPGRAPVIRGSGDIIVYTAHQGWLSRIYLLRPDGSVITYYEYDFYFFADLEVVNNEVYAAEAFAPRVYKIDLDTGGLEVVIDDWSLYYFYGLAFDGTHFYVKEWDLNRYDINGDWMGMASFDEFVAGGAWDGAHLWTLSDENQIKCWDISLWPTVTELPLFNFAPPSPACRGLWFDGEYFWTAENLEGQLGYIYQFNYQGTIVNQWLEPAFQGWSACVVSLGVPGDFDDDGDVDLADYGVFADCLAGPDEAPTPSPPTTPDECRDVFDFDLDTDVDMIDLRAWVDVVTLGD